MSRLHINRPPPAKPLHECTLTIHLDGKEPMVLPPICDTPNQLAYCYKCRRRRRAKNLLVIRQAWYDPYIYCADDCVTFKKRRNAQARRRYAARKKAEASNG
jgi:hypothetical protein